MTEKEFEFSLIKPGGFDPSWSRFLEVVFVLQGSGSLQAGGASYDLRENDIFTVNSFSARCIALDAGSLAVALRVSPFLLGALSPETEEFRVNCKSFLFSPDRQEPFDLLRRDFALAFRGRYKKESPLRLRSRIAVLLDDLLRDFSEKPGSAGAGVRGSPEGIRQAVDYLHRHFRDNIALGDVAARCGLSAPYLSRSFHKRLGVSFTAYLVGIRLMHAAALLRGNGTVTDIALESGFSGASALIAAFRRHRAMTPGQYRVKARKGQDPVEESPPGNGESFSTAFASLLKHMGREETKTRQEAEIHEVSANAASPLAALSHTWKRLINAGYARDLQNGSLREQLRSLQNGIGFAHIRCKGLLDDDMMILNGDDAEFETLNFVYLDEAVDFILSCGAKPFLELGHMPSVLAKQRTRLFRRPAIFSLPTDRERWQRLVRLLMEHLAERYGLEELSEWIFAPWISLGYAGIGNFSVEDYIEVYAASHRIIRDCCGDIRIAGPGSPIHAPRLLERFLELCGEQGCLPDIVSLHSFAAVSPGEEASGLELVANNEAFYVAVSGDESYLANALRKAQALAGDRPVMLDEWSNTIWQRDLCNDTCYKSSWIFKSVLENYDSFYAMGYFSAADQLDEIAPARELFHGGFGLFARNGLPKSACRALELLARAGNTLLARGDGWFIAASETELQIFLYNYCHYDMLYRYRHTAHINGAERYRVFNEKPPRQYHISLEGLAPGPHRVRRYSIGRAAGSAYDAWLGMGAPDKLSLEEEMLLQSLSHPAYRRETVDSALTLSLGAWLSPHEVQLITVSR